MESKKGAIGDAFEVVIQVIVILVCAFIIFGGLSVYYNYYIEIKDSEAEILAEQVYDCLVSESIFDLSQIPKEYNNMILDYCGFDNTERFFVNLSVSGKSILKQYSQGDPSAMWIISLLKKLKQDDSKFNPSYNNFEIPVMLKDKELIIPGIFKITILVKYEESNENANFKTFSGESSGGGGATGKWDQ